MESIRQPAPTGRHAFTMVEILVVTAIIAILVALSIPAAGWMSQIGQRASITSQMRQWSLAVFQYTSENDGLLPGPLWGSQNFRYKNGRSEVLLSSLAPYLGVSPIDGNWRVAEFLMTARQRQWARQIGSESAEFYRVLSSGNVKPFGYSAGSTLELPMKLSAVPDPANTSMLRECDQQAKWIYPSNGGFSDFPPAPLHGNARFEVFFDGSLQTYSVEETNR